MRLDELKRRVYSLDDDLQRVHVARHGRRTVVELAWNPRARDAAGPLTPERKQTRCNSIQTVLGSWLPGEAFTVREMTSE